MMRASFSQMACIAFALSLASNALTDELPAYQPRPVAALIDASYLSTDNSILIIGSEGTGSLLKKFNELFVATHPGLKLTLMAKGLPSVGLYGIITGVSAFALLDREIWPLETRPFRQIYGYEPTGIRIGRAGYAAPGRMNPPGIYVNAKNPLRGLTVEQVARVFTTGGGSGDITSWGQLGLPGEWSQRVIHLYGPRDDGSMASAMRHAKLGGFPFARRYEPQSTSAQIMQAVADDPYGIALAGFSDVTQLSAAVKMLPLATEEGQPYAGAGLDEVTAGTYPFAQYLMLYVNREPGKPLDPFIKEYARLVLSREGQAIIAAQKSSPGGYLPLTASAVAREVNMLEP
jgi:phosphate transport system substrate-binding protein